jgi:hypothetical protein
MRPVRFLEIRSSGLNDVPVFVSRIIKVASFEKSIPLFQAGSRRTW